MLQICLSLKILSKLNLLLVALDEAYELKSFGCELKVNIADELDPSSGAPSVFHQQQAQAMGESVPLNSVQSLALLIDRLNSLDPFLNDDERSGFSRTHCPAKHWHKLSDNCRQSITYCFLHK